MLLKDPRARRIVDLFRALAILLVIFFHVLYGLARSLPPDQRQEFAAGFPGILNIGWQALGSEMIFLFSGFLVSYLLIAEYRAEGRIALGPYLWRRAARILPLYYVALAFYTLALQPELANILASAIFLGYVLRGENVIPVGWSMEAMMQVYVALPFIVAFVMRGTRPGWRIAGLIAAFLALRLGYIWLSDDTFSGLLTDAIATTKFSDAAADLYFMSWFRATPFLLGLWLAWMVAERGTALAGFFNRFWMPALITALVLLVGSSSLPVQDASANIYAQTGERFWELFWGLQRMAFASGGALLALVMFFAPPFRQPWLLRFLDRGPWKLIAENIYGIYLFHFAFILLAAVIVFRSTEEAVLWSATIWHILAVTVLAAALSLGASVLMRRWIENPARRVILARVLPAKPGPDRGGIRKPG